MTAPRCGAPFRVLGATASPDSVRLVLCRSRRLLLVLVPAVLALLAGCRATADVAIDVESDGSGTVTLTGTFDREAIEQIGGDPAVAVRTDDLAAAGWKVSGPTTSGGETVVRLAKPFASADRLGAVLDEIGGPDGPFVGWKLSSENSFTVASYELTGRMRLTGSLEQFSDAEVAAALDGFALGRSAEEVAAAVAADPDALSLTVSVNLPGELDGASGLSEQDDGEAAVATYDLGGGTAVDTAVTVSSSSTDRSAVLWMIVGGGLILAAGLLAVAVLRRGRRRRPPATV